MERLHAMFSKGSFIADEPPCGEVCLKSFYFKRMRISFYREVFEHEIVFLDLYDPNANDPKLTIVPGPRKPKNS